MAFCDRDLERVAPPGEVDHRLSRYLGGEPRAASALDAALTVQQDERRQGDRLGEVPLFLYEPALTRPVSEGLVLKRALATFVAHGTVEGMIDQQELEHPVLRFSYAL